MDENYYSMFGKLKEDEIQTYFPKFIPIDFNYNIINSVMEKAGKKKWVLAFVIGTKPCFYKFFGSIVEAHKADVPYIIINSEQHYDDILTHGIKEFDIYKDNIAINLHIRGNLAQKSAEILSKMSYIASYFLKKFPDVTVVPVVLGDTILTSIVPIAWMFTRNEKVIQNEAGLRSMTAKVIKEYKNTDIDSFIDKQFNGEWMLLRNEPFPEQWNTYVSAAGSEYHFAPLEINKQHLLREGYPEENIFVIGGVVVDALNLKLKEKVKKSIFDIYPQLENGEWLRVDIHRKENITETRFKNIIKAIKILVEKGYNINVIEMNATKYGIDTYGLRKDIEKLEKNKKKFLLSPVWPEFSHVIRFFKSDNFFSALTDSGGVQEELNLLGKPCMTCRFSTDRPETVNQAKSNILVPPVDENFIVKLVEKIYNDEGLIKTMKNSNPLYGKDVGRKFVNIIKEIMDKDGRTFSWAHETLGIWREKNKSEFL